jgi:hypothetical protein
MFILPTLKGLAGNSLSVKTFKNAALDLNFAFNKSLVDSVSGNNLISFTRASSGTYVGSDGLIKTAVTNNTTYSQDFGNAAIGKNNSTVTDNTATSPVGDSTADKVTEDVATSEHGVTLPNFSYAASTVYTFTIFAKAVERNRLRVLLPESSFGQNKVVWFDLSDGSVIQTSGTGITSSVVAYPDGWYRCAISATTTIAASGTAAQLRLVNTGTTVTYTGNGTSGIFLWGAQLEQSSTAGEYIPTTSTINSAPRFDHNPTTGESLGLLVEEPRTNLSLYSEDFTDASWTKTDCTITANESTAPDGTTTADLWTNTASPGSISNSITKDGTSRTYTSSIWVKGTMAQFTVTLDNGGTGIRGRVQYNLSTNTVGSVFNEGFTNTSGTLTPYPNGWVRLTLTTTTSTGTTIRLRPFFSGTGSTVRIWGAQVEEGAFATSYIPTGASGVITPGYASPAVTRAADVASITGTNFGTTRTNYIRNNTMVGAVAGTPGTLPTNWSTAGSAALSTQIVGTGTDNGINYIDIRCFGTTAAVASPEIYFNFDVPPAISVAQNQTWTTSCYAKIVGGTQTGIVGGEIYVLGLNSSSVLTEAAPTNFNYSSLTGEFSTCRVSKTHTFTVATTVYSQQRIDVNFTAGGGTAVDFTLRIGMPQMEVGSVATAAIPTTTVAASVFNSSWYNQTEGTVFANYAERAFSVTHQVVTFSNGTNNERISFTINSTNTLDVAVISGGTDTFTGNTPTLTAQEYQIGFGYKADNSGVSANGSAITVDSAVTLPTVSQLDVGARAGSSQILNSTIKRLTYWPVRLADPTLQAITIP